MLKAIGLSPLLVLSLILSEGVLLGVSGAAAMGVLGSLLPAGRAARLPLASALHQA